jgi:hypothetical protein
LRAGLRREEKIILLDPLRGPEGPLFHRSCTARADIQPVEPKSGANWDPGPAVRVTKVPWGSNEYFRVLPASNRCKIGFGMGHPAIIRTGFASAEDAAEIYGVSLNRVKELRRLLRRVKTQASQKPTASARKRASVRSARKAKLAAKRASTSRKASRRAA